MKCPLQKPHFLKLTEVNTVETVFQWLIPIARYLYESGCPTFLATEISKYSGII